MDKKTYSNLIVSSSPHIVSNTDTTRIMAMVLLALAPAFLVSIYVFGFESSASDTDLYRCLQCSLNGHGTS